jgi:nucleoside-diphosphate-sugar epimerase
MKKIAILGVTGYIGESLLEEFIQEQECIVYAFSRTKNGVKSFLDTKNCSSHLLDDFLLFEYDIIINCTGVGDPKILKKDPSQIFKVTEEIDALIIGYITEHQNVLYINLSSGAVYGDNFRQPIESETKSILNMGSISPNDYYAVAKINSEIKHRSLSTLNIVDLRVFAFFSKYVDTSAGFLMSEIVDCIKNKKVFVTNGNDIVRDYITPRDLYSLIQAVMQKEKINDFFDVYSKKEVSKFELLDFLKKKYNFEYSVKEDAVSEVSLTKNFYYSKNKKAQDIGYSPELTSLLGIEKELNELFLVH